MIRPKFCILAGIGFLAIRPAQAGPPFVTDDPEPVEYQRFEINTAAQATYVKGSHSGALPSVDINYGPFPDTQFHVGLWAPFSKTDGQGSAIGYGDTEFGLKYRFVDEDEDGWRPQLAIYPNIDLPTGNAHAALGAGHTRVLLPLWAQKSVGDWTSYGGGGYWLNQAGDSRNYWFMGWALLRRISEEWTLGGEVFHQTADLKTAPVPSGNGVSSHASTGFNFGGYYNIDDDDHIIFTFGKGLQNVAEANQFSYYVGYQLVF